MEIRRRFALLLVGCCLSVALAQWGPDWKLSTTDSAATLNENMGRCIVTCGDTVHVIWCDTRNNGSAIYYKRSSDQGTTWGPDVRLSDTPGYASFPTLAVSGTTVHLAFRDQRTGRYLSYYKRSTDGGRTWGEDAFLSDSTLFNWWPAIAAVGSNVHLALNMDTVNSEVYFRRSTDSGETWDSIVRISNAPLRSEDPCIAASDSFVHIVWNEFRHGGNGHSEVYYRRSSDRGATWGAETRLTFDTAMSYSPTVYPSGSTVDVAWEDSRDGNFEIYHKRSTDFGETWGEDERLTDDSAASVYPSIAVNGANIHLFWFSLGSDSGVYYLHSGDNGASWDSTVTLVGGTSAPAFPFVALTDSVLHAIWRDMRDGHGAIYYKRNMNGNVGTGESHKLDASSFRLVRTIFHGALNLQSAGAVLDAGGRKVLDLRPGPNDVSSLAPGVYFVCQASRMAGDTPSLTRVILTR